MIDLAPNIYRQRLVIEAYPKKPINDDDIKKYLSGLSATIGMKQLIEPVTHRSDAYGWAGWVHWETSGAHFYAWDQPTLFYSVDIYTCKAFDPQVAINYTKQFFDSDTIEYKEF
jgi:S-adenosylmethionine decarboxylase